MSADDIAALGAAYVEGDLDPISRSHLAEVVQQEPAQADVLAQQMRTHLLLRALLHQGAATEVVRRARLIPRGFTADRSKRLVDSARALSKPPMCLRKRLLFHILGAQMWGQVTFSPL